MKGSQCISDAPEEIRALLPSEISSGGFALKINLTFVFCCCKLDCQ
jgi:hypothetical protein